jgi:hypothetical protein
MAHSRGCDGCGAVRGWPHAAVDRRTGNVAVIHLCSRCITAPRRAWRRRYQLAGEIEGKP